VYYLDVIFLSTAVKILVHLFSRGEQIAYNS
jgi:hypothetical protein